MSNVVTLSGPNPTQQIVSQFLDQFNANQRSREQTRMQQAQLDQQATQHADQFSIEQGNLAVNQGQLKDMQDKFALIKQQYADADKQAQAKQYIERIASYHDAIQSMQPNDPQRAALEAQAKSEAASIPPELMPYVKIATLEPILTPKRQAELNTGNFAAKQTGIAAGGGTDPNAVNFATKAATGSFMPSEGFTQQQATDLAARDAAPDSAGTPTPDLSKKIPAPSGNSISDYESRATLAMPTAPQNLTSQTAITQTGMQGNAQRDVARIGAKSAMDLQKAKEATPAVAASVVQGVITDPQSYFSLPTEDKKIVLQTLNRAPSKLSAAEIDRVNAAKFGAQLIDDADQIVKKWQGQGKPITGPVLGRFNAAEGTWGDMIIPPDLPPEKQHEYAQDISKLREWLTALPIMEAKALAGGRTAYQVIEKVTAAAPSMSKGQDMFEGSVQGLRTRFAQIDDHLTKKQWGGKPPQGAGVQVLGTSAATITTPDGLKWTKNADGSMTQVP